MANKQAGRALAIMLALKMPIGQAKMYLSTHSPYLLFTTCHSILVCDIFPCNISNQMLMLLLYSGFFFLNNVIASHYCTPQRANVIISTVNLNTKH